LSDPLGDQEDLDATLRSRERRIALSNAGVERMRAAILADSYVFTKRICKHNDLVPAVHMPVSYLACGLTDRLIETLEIPALDGYVTRQLRRTFRARFRQFGDRPWNTREGRAAIDLAINGSIGRPAILNFRMFRRVFKSSVITHGATLFIATNDPNETIKLTHNVDPKAWAFCEQIAMTILSGTYIDWFPDRIPEGDLSKLIGQKRITLGGRTISHPQKTIEAGGFDSTDESAHYNIFVTDDLVTDNSELSEIREIKKYMKRMTGFYMPTRRVRRIEVGTKHDEDDDDTLLCAIEDCITLRIPIEEHDGEIVNILERGTPTCPQIFSSERITFEQSHVLSGKEDEDGYRVWWNQYLLSASGGTLRLFPPSLVDDPEHWWLGPYDHPNPNWRKRGHYLIARHKRTLDGRPIQNPKRPSIYDENGELREDWFRNAVVVAYDPWTDLDRAILVDPAWSEREFTDNWGVSCVGQDPDDVKFQLQTLSDTDGIDGWVSALVYLDEIWHPRVIGFDGTATQDPMIRHLLDTDKRLRRFRSRMIEIERAKGSKAIRIKEGVAEPMKVCRYLLAPPYDDVRGGHDRFGGNITRSELKLIKSTPKHPVRTDQDGIADSLTMAGSVLRAARVASEKLRAQPRPRYDPILGIPLDPIVPVAPPSTSERRTAVVLHSTDRLAVEATRATMRSLNSDLIEEQGRFYIPGSTTDYPVWAALRQGYVKGLAAL
jgi:hypothetical protein